MEFFSWTVKSERWLKERIYYAIDIKCSMICRFIDYVPGHKKVSNHIL